MRTLGLCIIFLVSLCSSVKPAMAQEDKTPPTVHYISVAPAYVDTSLSSQTITVIAHVTDDLSGVTSVTFMFEPASDPSKYFFVMAMTPLGGDMFMGTAELPQNSLLGPWRVDYIAAHDSSNNIRFYLEPPWPPGNGIFMNGSNFLYLPQIRNSVIQGLPPRCVAPGAPINCLP
jgi:hypothetical protein